MFIILPTDKVRLLIFFTERISGEGKHQEWACISFLNNFPFIYYIITFTVLYLLMSLYKWSITQSDHELAVLMACLERTERLAFGILFATWKRVLRSFARPCNVVYHFIGRAEQAKARPAMPVGNASEGEVQGRERGRAPGSGGGGKGGGRGKCGERLNLRERRSLQFRPAFSHCPANISVEHRIDRRVVATLTVEWVPVKRTVYSEFWSVGAVLSDSVFLAIQSIVYR